MPSSTLKAAVVLLGSLCLATFAWAQSSGKILPALSATAESASAVCPTGQATVNLDINNARARLYNTGGLYFRQNQGSIYQLPVGTERSPMFSSAIWIGGEVDGALRMAATDYGPYEFWPGPLASATDPDTDCAAQDRMYSVFLRDLLAYENGEPATADMLDWPWQLGAPVLDGDGDPNNYDLEAGDRPEVLGQQTIWWVMNDAGGEHDWSGSEPLNMEVQVTAFAAVAGLPAVDNATLYRFRLVYGGDAPLENAYFGWHADADLGSAADDYAGSDSTRGLAFVYNADDNDDGDGGYGSMPPATGVIFIETPEDLGLTNFLTYDFNTGIQGNPEGAEGAYAYLQSTWQNGEPLTVGGNGLGFSEERTRYMFAGEPGEFWSESNTDDRGLPNTPTDRRFVASTGPFTMQPGESTDLLAAVIWAQGSDHLDSVAELRETADELRNVWDNGFDFQIGDAPSEVPGLVSPGDGATGQPVDAILYWADAGLTRYQLQVSPSSTFETLVVDELVSGTTFGTDALPQDVTHFWRVRALNVAGFGPWSETFSFLTGMQQRPAQDALRLEGNPAFVQVAAPDGFDPCGSDAASTFGCAEVGGNFVYPSLDATASYIMSSNGFGPERSIGVFAPNDFELRFTEEGSIAVNVFTSSRGTRVPFEVWDIGAVGPFSENDPSDDVQLIPALFADNEADLAEEEAECMFGYTSITEDPLGFGWPGTQRIYGYYPTTTYDEFEAGAQSELDAAGGCGVLSPTVRAGINFSPGRPLQRIVFYGDPESPFFQTEGPLPGHVIRFYTRTIETPILASPSDGAAPEGRQLSLYWYGGAALQISRDIAFADVVLEDVEAESPFGIPQLDAGTYYWRAGNITDTDTLWTEPWSFTLATPVSAEQISGLPEVFTIRAGYPNPFTSTTTLPYGLPEATDVTASVFDLLGRRVATLAQNERRPAGWHELRIDGARWPSGVYFVELTAGDQRVSRRLVKIN
ncbi:MAG: T9SS type A sorting domain-containing protein [Bacteroidota bacterium]